VKDNMKKLSIFAAMMVVMAGVALASTLDVPFFFDNNTNGPSGANSATGYGTGEASFINVKETSGSDQTVTVIYTAINTSGTPSNQTVTFFLPGNQAVAWTPVSTNHPAENAQSVVIPNMTIVGPNTNSTTANQGGSAQIIAAGSVAGFFQRRSFARATDMAHVLLPRQ